MRAREYDAIINFTGRQQQQQTEPCGNQTIMNSCLEIYKCMNMYHDETCSAKSDVSNLFYSEKNGMFKDSVYIYVYML